MIFFCIADPDSSIGFTLAGVETREVLTKSEASHALKVALAMENIGIILVTEKAANLMRQDLDEYMYSQEIPLVLEIPSHGSTLKRKSTSELLKEIVGVSI